MPRVLCLAGEILGQARVIPVLGLVLSTALLLSGAARAQVLQPPGSFHGHHHADAPDEQSPAAEPPDQNETPSQTVPAPPQRAAVPAPAPSAAAVPPSVLDQAPQPAKVDLSAGKLTIHADNSSLTAILNQVSTSAGMTIDGLSKDQRVFGTYGPGEPREVLSALLDGTGYNVLMFGSTAAGTPSQLTLSPRGAPLSTGQANGMRNPVRQSQDEDDEEQPTPTQYQETPPASPPPAPPANPNGGVRSPQQMLQDLQQMRQQQQQQQQQQPQN